MSQTAHLQGGRVAERLAVVHSVPGEVEITMGTEGPETPVNRQPETVNFPSQIQGHAGDPEAGGAAA